MENIDNIIIKILGKNIDIPETSSGSSILYSSKNSDQVCQVFQNSYVSDRIASYMLQLNALGIVRYEKIFKKFGKQILDINLTYNPFTYICPFEYYIINKSKKNIIVWKKINPLNKGLISKKFLSQNYLKICYDISKALHTLKLIDVLHNDTVLDNIGIYNGNFVLFDFDASGKPEDKGKDFSDDFISLKNSFDFHEFPLPIKNYTGIISVIMHVSELQKISYQEAYRYLESLQIVY